MLYAMTMQALCTGFLFHWLISDGMYLESNMWMKNILYFLFIINMTGLAYGHVVLSRNKQIIEALQAINNNTA